MMRARDPFYHLPAYQIKLFSIVDSSVNFNLRLKYRPESLMDLNVFEIQKTINDLNLESDPDTELVILDILMGNESLFECIPLNDLKERLQRELLEINRGQEVSFEDKLIAEWKDIEEKRYVALTERVKIFEQLIELTPVDEGEESLLDPIVIEYQSTDAERPQRNPFPDKLPKWARF